MYERLFIWYTVTKTMFAEYTQLYFGHVEPTAMLRRVMKLQPPGDTSGLGRCKYLIERPLLMRIEIVHDQSDHVRFWKGLIHQPLQLMSKVFGSSMLGHFDVSPASQGLYNHEQVAGSISLILIVASLASPRPGWNPFHRVCHQLLRCLIAAYYWAQRVGWFFVQVQQVFHTRLELPAHFRDAPFLAFPRLELVFLESGAPSPQR